MPRSRVSRSSELQIDWIVAEPSCGEGDRPGRGVQRLGEARDHDLEAVERRSLRQLGVEHLQQPGAGLVEPLDGAAPARAATLAVQDLGRRGGLGGAELATAALLGRVLGRVGGSQELIGAPDARAPRRRRRRRPSAGCRGPREAAAARCSPRRARRPRWCPSRSTANSSPDRRAGKAAGNGADAASSASATRFSARSPAWWPRASLIALSSSTSQTRSVTGVRWSCQRAVARSSRSSKARRLARPVRSSS